MEAWRKELYLAHHGIKGQRWGVRNGPPYPLSMSKRSASEKKAGLGSSIKKAASKAVRRMTDPKRVNRAITVANAYSRVAMAYAIGSMFNMPLASPVIAQYAKAAHEIHKELSTGVSKKNRRHKGLETKSEKAKSPLKVLSKPNEPSELHQDSDPPTAKFFAKFIPSVANNLRNCRDYTIKNKNGQTIGEFSTELKNKGEEMNISWLGIRDKYGNKGYGQSAMRLAIDDARKQGVKYVTLEVPTVSPNARHIYEKLGFKETSKGLFTSEDDVWGGLTEMRLDL